MGRNRIVRPVVVRLPLSDGDWIDVKKQLTVGEVRHIFERQIAEYRSGERARIDPHYVGLSQVLEYLVGWSLADGSTPVPCTESGLLMIDSESYLEIESAITHHIAAHEAHEAAAKNEKDGATPSSAISPSVGG